MLTGDLSVGGVAVIRDINVVTTVPVPSFGQSQVTIAMTPPWVETTAGTNSGVASLQQDGLGTLASAGASMEQDVLDVPGYMQEVMMEAGALHDDLSAWLSRYQLTPVAPIG